MKRGPLSLVLLIGLGCLLTPEASIRPTPPLQENDVSTGEEFTGPFPSWADAKSAYGAVGDGVADDTAALQKGLRDLGAAGRSPVLYLPPGRYRITATLTLAYSSNVALIGADPDEVFLVWDGPEAGTMLSINGVAYSRFSRVTFDGRRRASTAVDQSWDNSRPYFDTGNEYADDRFLDLEYGIRGGFKGFGFAETAIVRGRFIRNSKAGVALGNFNALDAWIWRSTFEECTLGVTNETGAGNFHVYDSVFRRSKVADMSIQNTGGFSIRGNYSVDSRAFFISGPSVNHPATIDIQGNTIIDPADSTAIRIGNQGPALIVDNTIRSLPGTIASVVSWKTFFDSDVVSVGNTYTVSKPVAVTGRHLSVDDRTVPRSTITPTDPPDPRTPRVRQGQVFEVASGADARSIQQTIDAAAAKSGNRPIVHVPHGTYSIATTLTVPASDLRIVGDGGATRLQWTGAGTGPVMRVLGPSTVILRDFEIGGRPAADGLIVENIDQEGSRVYLDGVQISHGSDANLLVKDLAHADVQAINFGHQYLKQGVSIRVSGSRLSIFSGASSNNAVSYDASGGADVLVRDMWYEGDSTGGFANVHDEVQFTLQGSRVSSPADLPRAAIVVSDLKGQVALLTSHFDDRIAVSGATDRSELLVLGALREYRGSAFLANTGAAAGRTALLSSRQRVEKQGFLSRGTTAMPDVPPSPEFVRAMLKSTRARTSPSPLVAVPPGASDVRLFRVYVTGSRHNLTLTRSSAATN